MSVEGVKIVSSPVVQSVGGQVYETRESGTAVCVMRRMIVDDER